jgi:site-specific DNA-cytosine methylase
VHNDTPRKQALQELYFHSADSVACTLTCAHPLKFWDLGRHATPRETARLQGFPETFVLPQRSCSRLFGNAVAVPCATHACSRLTAVDAEDGAAVPLRYIDLCAGIGGFALAVHATWPHAQCVGFSEILPAAVACYRANFPDAPALGDATKVAQWPLADLLVAGFPCQPFTSCQSAERRETHRSRDFFAVVLAAIQSSGASRVVLENVNTLPATGGHRWDALRQGLTDMGFALEWSVLDASHFGVPQARKRLYLAASRTGVPPRPMERETTRTRPTLRDILEDVATPPP